MSETLQEQIEYGSRCKPHGVPLGTPGGADLMCGLCESGMTTWVADKHYELVYYANVDWPIKFGSLGYESDGINADNIFEWVLEVVEDIVPDHNLEDWQLLARLGWKWGVRVESNGYWA